MQAQTQAQKCAHVAQEAGEGRAVHVHPGGVDTPALGLLQGPQQVHTQGPQQQVEAHGEGGEEKCDAKVLLQAGAVDPLHPGEDLSNNETCQKKGKRERYGWHLLAWLKQNYVATGSGVLLG